MSDVSEAIGKNKKGEVSTEEHEDYTNHELEKRNKGGKERNHRQKNPIWGDISLG